ncbi:MAG: 50S ribosomal protein L10 [Pseudomonadota bacterium]|mgnify:FL=1|nr:50S ribosomal protein L10 [Alphaproteobacteria bacterium]MCS5595712.1 50S ribosomal protein L10 [Alphaproteobacteria bacterium]MEC7701478.1 50S ribosomal protein L10 [Pseudomonadota bacterium]
MDRAQKAQELENLQGIFSSEGEAPTEGIVIAHYAGLTVAQMTELRRNSRAQGVTIKVTKNSLAKRAVAGSQFEGISDLFAGPTCMAYSNDPVATAKVVQEFAEKNEKLVVLGGALGVNVLDANGVKALSKMPSLDELRGKIVGLIQAPATKIAGVVSAPAGQLARVVGAYAAKDS